MRKKWLAGLILTGLFLGVALTVTEQNRQPLAGFVESGRTIITTAEPPPEELPDMKPYTDAGLSLLIPEKWAKVIKNGDMAFVDGNTSAYVRVSILPYVPGLSGITEEKIREDTAGMGAAFLSFEKEGNSGYTVRYQMSENGTVYDYTEISRIDLECLARVTVCLPDDAYPMLAKEIAAVENSVTWEPANPVPEGFLLAYNDFGSFEFAVPLGWDRGIETGEYVARDPGTGAEMHVSVSRSEMTYENVNQAVYAEFMSEGKEGFSIRQFSCDGNLIYSVSSYMMNGFEVYRVDYLLATGAYEYGIAFSCPVDCYTEKAPLFEQAFSLFRLF